MQCVNCKAQLPGKAKFCPECGVSISAATEASAAQQIGAVETGGGVAGAPRGDHGQVGGKRQYGDRVGKDKIGRDKAGRDIIHININPPPGADRRSLVDYLRALRRQCNVLPLAALSKDEGPHQQGNITLSEVYIDLATNVRVPLAEDERAMRKDKQLGILEDRENSRPLRAMEAAVQNARLVVIGDPGSGKSTFVNHLAYLLAGACLGENGPPEGWTHGVLLPVYISLRELAKNLPESGKLGECSVKERADLLVEGIWNHLRKELEVTYHAPGALPFLEQEVNEGRALVIFDGLDEVASGKYDAAREAIAAFHERCGPGRMLATCRVRYYSDLKDKKKPLPGFDDILLAPFDETRIAEFIKRWYEALAAQGALKPQDAERRAADLRAAVAPLMELARNPLLLTTMAVVHTTGVKLPRERACLYQRCVEVLISRWQGHKTGEEPLLKLLNISESTLLAALREVAFEAHAKGGGEEGNVIRSRW